MAKRKGKKEGCEFFEGIRDAMTEFRDDLASGRKLTARMVIHPEPPKAVGAKEIKKLRSRLNVSQSLFAELLNCSASTVRAWECGAKKPSGPSLRLLEMVVKNPECFLLHRA